MPFHASESERDETATVKVGPPRAAIEAAPVNCFPIALPQSDSGLQSNDKTKHKGRTAAVIFITKLKEFFDSPKAFAAPATLSDRGRGNDGDYFCSMIQTPFHSSAGGSA
jgi:hypothetical protein